MQDRVRILLIDSEADSQTRAVAALEAGGYGVTLASDGDRGLEELHRWGPDLVIVSSDLPRMRGEEAYMRVRQASTLPMIALGRREEDDREVLQAGVDAYMTKPVNPRELLARVRSLLWRAASLSPVLGVSERADGGNGSNSEA